MEILDVGTPTDDAQYSAACFSGNCRLKAEGLTVEELRTLLAQHEASHRVRVSAAWQIDGA
jgi:hypothetical protein